MLNQNQIDDIVHTKSLLRPMVKDRLSEIFGTEFAELAVKNDIIVTGGCISAVFLSEHFNDIDLYFKSSSVLNTMKDYITDKKMEFIKKMSTYSLRADDTALCITPNAITMENNLQFITLGTAHECRERFDFIHCMPWYDFAEDKLHISEAQYNSIKTKTLEINPKGENVKNHRIQKYKDRGWNVRKIADLV